MAVVTAWCCLGAAHMLRCPLRAPTTGDWAHPHVLIPPSFSPPLGHSCCPLCPDRWGQLHCPWQSSQDCLLKPGPGERCHAEPHLTQVVHVHTSQFSLPQSKGIHEMPQGPPKTRHSHGTSPCQPLTGFPQQLFARSPGSLCWAAGPGWCHSPDQGTESHRTGLEHGGKQGIAQPTTHSQPPQRRRLLCKQLFTTGFVARISPPATWSLVLTQPHAANNHGTSAAPTPMSPRGRVALGPWESSLGGHTASTASRGAGLLAGRDARGCGQLSCSPHRLSKGFSPQISPAQGPAPACSGPGGSWGHGSLGWAQGWFPQHGLGAALATFPWV